MILPLPKHTFQSILSVNRVCTMAAAFYDIYIFIKLFVIDVPLDFELMQDFLITRCVSKLMITKSTS